MQVIGVVRDFKSRSLTEAPRPAFFRLAPQAYAGQMSLVLRAVDAQGVIARIRREIQSERPGLAPVDVRSMRDVVEAAINQRRNGAGILAFISALGVLLSAIGLYGVVAFGISQRTAEFGLRMALGATRGAILRSVLRQGMQLALIGFGVGLPLSFAFTAVLRSAIVGVQGQSVATLGVVGVLLIIVSGFASLAPAFKATTVEPSVALRGSSR